MELCNRELANKIVNSTNPVEVDGLTVDIREIPDIEENGVFDPREYFIRKAMFDFKQKMPKRNAVPTVEEIRSHTKTFANDLNDKDIKEKKFTVDVKGRTINVYYYSPCENCKDKQAVIYIHGGSFFAGEASSYKHVCRYISEKADAVVFNIEYSLAPENKYPAAIEDCLGLINEIYNNSENYGIDKNKIALSGDSAGGNLAIATTLNLPKHISVNYLGLFYPCVDMMPDSNQYQWEESKYCIAESQRELITSRLSLGRADGQGNNELMGMIFYCYLPQLTEEYLTKPDVSPVYADLSILPKCTLFTAEFDGLRLQDEYFGKLLNKQGVDSKVIRFNGVSHAFLDYLGILPQAEASLMIMIEDLKNL